MLLALVGLTAGQAVVWYTGRFYALFLLEKTLKGDGSLANMTTDWEAGLGTALTSAGYPAKADSAL